MSAAEHPESPSLLRQAYGRFPFRLAAGAAVALIIAAVAPEDLWRSVGLTGDLASSLIIAATGFFVVVNLWGLSSQSRLQSALDGAAMEQRRLRESVLEVEDALARLRQQDEAPR